MTRKARTTRASRKSGTGRAKRRAPLSRGSGTDQVRVGESTLAPVRLLTTTELLRQLRVSRTWFWHERRRGGFPEPVRLGAFALRWRQEDVDRWITERQARSGAAA